MTENEKALIERLIQLTDSKSIQWTQRSTHTVISSFGGSRRVSILSKLGSFSIILLNDGDIHQIEVYSCDVPGECWKVAMDLWLLAEGSAVRSPMSIVEDVLSEAMDIQ